jgi:hypothetical protein
VERIRTVLRNQLIASYGPSSRCPTNPSEGEAPEQWARDGYYVLLKAMRAPSYGVVVVEQWLGEPSCHVEGAPYAA